MLGSGSSFKLARIFGIRIGVNASWFIVLFLFIYLFQDSFQETLAASDTVAFAVAVAAAVLFFGSILLHELGHAIAARREGIEVSGIELFLFGGVMKMSRDTDSPGAEFRVAAAGPLVTLLIVVVGGLVTIALWGPDRLFDAGRLSGDQTEDIPVVLLSVLVGFNVILLLFNLVPAFPLDGGRIARAIAWRLTGEKGRATRLAARMGQAFAILMVGYGLYRLADGDTWGLWYVMLGWLLGSSARTAILQSDFSDRLDGITVADLMDDEPVTIPAETPARARVRGLLPALPGLGLVRGRRRRRPPRGDRPPRAAAPGLRGRRPPAGRRARGAAGRGRPGARRYAARGAALLRAAAALRRADGGRRRRPAARGRDAGSGLARAAGAGRRRIIGVPLRH